MKQVKIGWDYSPDEVLRMVDRLLIGQGLKIDYIESDDEEDYLTIGIKHNVDEK